MSDILTAVILDWAGTTVDFGCVGPAAVFKDVFAKYGVEVAMEEVQPFMGLKKIDHVRGMCGLDSVREKWRARHGKDPAEDDVQAMYSDTEPMMLDCLDRHADLIPGVLEAVAAFRAMGLKVGSTSGYTRPMMEKLVPLAKAQGYAPDHWVSSTDVPAGRPAPYMVYANAIALAIHPLWTMVKVGDTVSDVGEGLSAGMWTIGLTDSGNEMGLSRVQYDAMDPGALAERRAAVETRLMDAGAHYTARSLADCPELVKDIAARLAKGERP